MMRNSIGNTLSVLGAVVVALGCEPMARNDVGIDCAAESEIEFFPAPADVSDHFGLAWENTDVASGVVTSAADSGFFCFADPSLDGYPTEAPWPSTGGCPRAQMKAIEGGPFCQEGAPGGIWRHSVALHLQAGNHVYWGGQWSNWNMRGGAVKATFPGVDPTTGETAELPADGIAFWAKKEIGSDSQILFQLEDEKVNAAGGICTAVAGSDSNQPTVDVKVTASDPNLQVSGSSAAVVDDPNACGNRWNAVLELSDEWELHLLPFDSFYQTLQPSREPAPLNPKTIYQVAFSYVAGQTVSIWLDEMFLYRNKP